jgi:phosphate-selective porin OprO/OprP
MDTGSQFDFPRRARAGTTLIVLIVLFVAAQSAALAQPSVRSNVRSPHAQSSGAADEPATVVSQLFAQPAAGELDYQPDSVLPPPPDLQQQGDHAADITASELAAILSRLDELEKTVAESALAAEKKPAEKSAADAKSAVEDWVDLSSEKWTVRLGGHVQLDWIHWADADDPPVPARDYFEFRRLRLLADGVGYGVYDFRIQIDIEPESGDGVATPVTDIKDAYLTMHELPCVDRWRIGNFFVPFSLEQVTNDTNNIFMERSIPTQGIFAADREVGMAFYGVNDAKNVTWTFGTFIDSISESLKERIDDNQGQRVSGRVTWTPYYDEPSNGRYVVHTGAGILYTDDQDGIVRFRARPQIHEGPFLIDTGNIAAGSYTTGNLEFATVWGPFSIQSEAFLSNVNRIADDSVYLYGAYVYGSYFLTGENRIYDRFGQHGAQFARNVPYSNFFWVPGCCGPGAWEAKARWSNLNLHQVDAGQYNDLTLGFNWYWTDRVRMMFDYIHPVTSQASTPFGATTSDIIAMRFDFNF